MVLRRFSLVIVFVGAIVFIVLQARRLFNDRSILPPDDFVEYYAAGQLNARGDNPYDPDLLIPIEIDAGREEILETHEAIMMWNPPWTLAVAMPFGLMESRAAQLLWLALGFVFIVFGADLLWQTFDGPESLRWVAWLLAFTFMPTFFVLHSGQIGTWLLAGIALFLYCHKRGWSMLAGAATVLPAIKPHLVYLFWIALVIWGVRRDRRMLLGGLIAGLAATAAALLANPQVFGQYWEALTKRSPSNWMSPTLGTLIRMAAGDEQSRFHLTFLPTALGLCWMLWNWRKTLGIVGQASSLPESTPDSRAGWKPAPRTSASHWPNVMPMLLLVSFVTASYGAWPFDLIILLPAVIQAATIAVKSKDPRLIRLAIGCWLAINGPALLLNVLKIKSFWFIWMAPAMLAAYWFLTRNRQTDHA